MVPVDMVDPRVRACYGLRGRRIGEARRPGPAHLSRHAAPIDLSCSVLPASMLRYNLALREYDEWASRFGLPRIVDFDFLDHRQVCALLVARLQQMALDLQPPTRGAYLMAGVMSRHPWLRRSSAEAWHALRVWQKATPVTSRVGLDERVYRAMVVVCLLWNWWYMAALLMIGFEGLLRPGELAALARRDIRLPCDAQGLPLETVIVSILLPKTRRQAARHQSVVIRRQWAVRGLCRLLSGVAPNIGLCAQQAYGLRRRFRQLLVALGIDGSAYSPGSLRPGGAVAFHLAHDDLGKLLYHGRWDSVRTVQHYLHEGASAAVSSCLPRGASELVLGLSALLEPLLAELDFG